MKIILTSLNSKFIHSNLAIRYLSTFVEDIFEIDVLEFTINQNTEYISREIYKMDPEIIGFSTYIWNLRETLEVVETLKKVKPDLKIILGGPEVSFDSVSFMKENPYVDYIVYGEGEVSFRELLKALDEDEDLKDIDGVVYREDSKIIKNKPRELIRNLDAIPSPYRGNMKDFENKIVYYESSRGCPFGCKFCLSSTIKGVRYFDIDRVKEDLGNLIRNNVRQVKFVDRTFNADKDYSMEVMRFIMDEDPKDINFHFEVTAHLIQDEMLDFLKKPKEGLFQFEIGVQSTNPETIKAIGRTTDFEKLKRVTKTISSYKNIHLHLDLIAGLPHENYNSFKKSFNDVYGLKPEKLQLGFLKLLKGSELREEEAEHGYKYLDQPPYEVLESKYIPYRDMVKLKGIEDLVEKYYNGDNFENTLEYIIEHHKNNAFEFYESFLNYWEEKRYQVVSHSKANLYIVFKEYIDFKNYKDKAVIRELLRYDYILNNKRSPIPNELKGKYQDFRGNEIHKLLKDEEILSEYLPIYKDIPTKRVINQISINKFEYNILDIIDKDYSEDVLEKETDILFDYIDGEIVKCNTYDITDNVKELF